MRVLEALAEEISRQKQIDALMKLKQVKERELKEIRTALRQIIQRQRWERKQMQPGSTSICTALNQNHNQDNYGTWQLA